jgi:hypothetical protein
MGSFRNERKERPKNLLGGPGGKVYVGMNSQSHARLGRGTRIACLTCRNNTLLERETQNVMNTNAATQATAEAQRCGDLL